MHKTILIVLLAVGWLSPACSRSVRGPSTDAAEGDLSRTDAAPPDVRAEARPGDTSADLPPPRDQGPDVARLDLRVDLRADVGVDTGPPDLPTTDAGERPSVVVKGGTFTQGSPANEPCRFASSEEQVTVVLTRDFVIDKYEVTQGEFLASMGYNPSAYSSTDPGCGGLCYCRSSDCSHNPVDTVSWYEAVAYCNARSQKAGYTPCFSCTGSGASTVCDVDPLYSGADIYNCKGYRLPTSAEFEVAYRAGTTTAFYNGPYVAPACNTSDSNQSKIGWGRMNTSGNGGFAVGLKLPNAWGLYDMAGNVAEWCHDWYTTALTSTTNPAGPATGTNKTLRGGSWGNDPYWLRAAARMNKPPATRDGFAGFRCVRSLQP